MMPQPPKWADRILEWYCNPDLIEDLQGDLYEQYLTTCNQVGVRKANQQYAWMVVRSFRLSALKRNQKLKNSRFTMATINFKIAARVLLKERVNTALNLFGLTIGIACFLLLGLYVKQETTFDQFHTKKDRLYRSYLKETYVNNNVFFNSTTPPRFEDFFEQNFPEVETAVQFNLNNYPVGRAEEKLRDQVAIISPEFFDVFDFDLAYGQVDAPLTSRESIILSKSSAKKYFGNEDPLGQTLGVEMGDETREFIVTAIFADPPISSSFQFGLAISNEINDEIFGERYRNAWFSVGPETYVLLKEGADPVHLSEQAEKTALELIGEARDLESYYIGMQPLTDIHLNPDIPLGYAPVVNPQYVYILGAIGLLVLIIACINYATLAIGQSIRRSKEVGVRKVLGAIRGDLFGQYMTESVLMSLLAMVLGTIIAIISIPAFNDLTNSQLQLVFEPWHLGAFLACVILIGTVAGIYPALVLSNLKIVKILAGRGQSANSHAMRKGMVVFQFLITIFLISSTLIMRQQVDYLQSEDLGYSYETALSVRLYATPGEDTSFVSRHQSAMKNGELLKQKLVQNPHVSNLAMASHTFGSNGWASLVATEEDGTYWRFRLLLTDPQFIPSFDIQLAEGRNFEEGNLADERQGVIINKAAAKLFALQDPIGKKLPPKNFGDHVIIGLTDDFHFSSLHNEVDPLVIVQNPLPIFQGVTDGDILDSPVPKLMFSYGGPSLTDAKTLLTEAWNEVFPNEEMRWAFLDETIKQQYESEARMNLLVTVATVMSIVIAVLGLIGLIILVVNSKVKEIGIRKVMGANAGQLFGLLSRSFAVQIGLAIVLSIPLTVWLMSQWLENFAYRIEVGPLVFLVSAVIAVLIVGGVIGYHTFRANRINPIKSLRTE